MTYWLKKLPTEKPVAVVDCTDSECWTEQEHKDSCDINLMLKAQERGMMIRGSNREPQYGVDDTTMDGLSFRIQKANLEEVLLNGQKEFTEEELKLFPKDIIEKFGYKLKKEAAQPKATNDDKTTKKPKEQPKKQAKQPEENKSDDSETGDS